MSEKLVLDSFALVSLFHKEPGWEMVQAALYEQQRAKANRRLSGTILTSDPEFRAVEHLVTVQWLTK